ncbi:MAG: hypothetical protein M9928_08160 [Anaerolineae bacterium]|nr:hypothetical protein [Anaerolineae bacterium]MCO5187609.1 hypothetical protein [Anaerolineae bacterium]MCO5194269.1 hypothetical protein [Anaerolineae bacterium]MCO5197379.1 hypothetical protein [Anaerolineae bacterium]MCO5204989.1 hypothetical protein [Anaerolineae bacterium]
MVHPQTEMQQTHLGQRVAPYIVAVIALIVGLIIGTVLVEWLFSNLHGSDALGIFLLGFAVGVVLIALIGSQVTRIPLWLVLIAGQIMTLLGLLLLVI